MRAQGGGRPAETCRLGRADRREALGERKVPWEVRFPRTVGSPLGEGPVSPQEKSKGRKRKQKGAAARRPKSEQTRGEYEEIASSAAAVRNKLREEEN